MSSVPLHFNLYPIILSNLEKLLSDSDYDQDSTNLISYNSMALKASWAKFIPPYKNYSV